MLGFSHDQSHEIGMKFASDFPQFSKFCTLKKPLLSKQQHTTDEDKLQ